MIFNCRLFRERTAIYRFINQSIDSFMDEEIADMMNHAVRKCSGTYSTAKLPRSKLNPKGVTSKRKSVNFYH